MTFAATAAAVAVAGSLLASGAGTAAITLTAPGHTPKISVHWPYTVSVKTGGKAAQATITAQIVDPIGGVHAVQFGKSTKNITNWHFKGRFSDFVIWPADSRGIPLTFRLIVASGATKKTIDYRVTPHG